MVVHTQTRRALKILDRLPGIRIAKGIVILTQIRGAWFFSGALAGGIFLKKDERGQWSPPTSVAALSGGAGVQFGASYTHIIIVLKDNAAVEAFESHGQLTLGATLGVAVGTEGGDAKAQAGVNNKGKFTSYASIALSKGVFLGFSLEGTVLTCNALDNYRFYESRHASVKRVMRGDIAVPTGKKTIAVKALHNALIRLQSGKGIHRLQYELKQELEELESYDSQSYSGSFIYEEEEKSCSGEHTSSISSMKNNHYVGVTH
uniref:Ysc84 actin-binding domain-containing protein n=1 Tax=Mucochytrium quahogii TaxID=96639 RepID=A0A7S2WC21_9STRA|mmetsp:Transcript_43403/g.69474  ORF Transcript_43403/g.69474 Transcript_43403/m.69474 type:complete len:261 (+) Transcript_43403:103-885(+)